MLGTNESTGRIVMFHGTDTFAPVASVIVTVKAYRPDVVPVPVMLPVAVSSVMPGGISPSAPNVNGARPPTALTPVARGWLTSRLAVRPVVGGVLSTRVWIPSG